MDAIIDTIVVSSVNTKPNIRCYCWFEVNYNQSDF